MAYLGYFPGCCGVRILDGVRDGTAEDSVRATAIYDSNRSPFVVFSTVVSCPDGDKVHLGRYAKDPDVGNILRQYIIDNKLGDVVTTPQAASWTNNILQVFLWTPDWDALAVWLKEHPAPPVPPAVLGQAVGGGAYNIYGPQPVGGRGAF